MEMSQVVSCCTG